MADKPSEPAESNVYGTVVVPNAPPSLITVNITTEKKKLNEHI